MNIQSALKSQYHAALKALRLRWRSAPMHFGTTLLTGLRRSGASSITRYFIRTSTCNRTKTPSSRGPGIAKKRMFSIVFPGQPTPSQAL